MRFPISSFQKNGQLKALLSLDSLIKNKMSCRSNPENDNTNDTIDNEQVPPRICRISCTLNYLTPTKRRNRWEITFENSSDNSYEYILIEANAYLPGLKIKDSYGHHLMVVPRHLLPTDIAKEEYAMLIQLKEPFKPGTL